MEVTKVTKVTLKMRFFSKNKDKKERNLCNVTNVTTMVTKVFTDLRNFLVQVTLRKFLHHNLSLFCQNTLKNSVTNVTDFELRKYESYESPLHNSTDDTDDTDDKLHLSNMEV